MEDKEINKEILKHAITCFEASRKEEQDKTLDEGTKQVHFGRVGAFLEIIRSYGELIDPVEFKNFKKKHSYFFR